MPDNKVDVVLARDAILKLCAAVREFVNGVPEIDETAWGMAEDLLDEAAGIANGINRPRKED